MENNCEQDRIIDRGIRFWHNKLLNWTAQQSENGTVEVLIHCMFQTKMNLKSEENIAVFWHGHSKLHV